MRLTLLLIASLFAVTVVAQETPPQYPEKMDVDVDAMARAKDVDAKAPPADVAAPTNTPTTDAPAQPPATNGAPSSTAPASTSSAETKQLGAACDAHATTLLDAAQRGDFATATRDFDAKMRTAMTPEKFRKSWTELAQFGALTARGQSHIEKDVSTDYIAVIVPLIFEKADLYAQVACGSDGRVAGFYVKPVPKQKAAAAPAPPLKP